MDNESVELSKFEARMLKLKGVRLPSRGYQQPTFSSKGRKAQELDNGFYSTLQLSVETKDGFDDTLSADEYEKTDDERTDDMHNISEALDDIVVGVVRSFDKASTHKGMKINKSVVISILDRMPVISSKAIMDNYGYSRSQAGHYLQACRLVALFYKRHSIKQSLLWLARFSE